MPSFLGNITVNQAMKKERIIAPAASERVATQPLSVPSKSRGPNKIPPNKALIPTKAAMKTSKAVSVFP